MSKIKCPSCGNKYKGNFCPVCASPAPAAERKKKKKWLLPVIVAAVLLVVLVSGGGDKKPEEQSSSLNAAVSVENIDQTQESKAAEEKPEEKPVLEETELYNANGITVTATGIKDGLFGTEIEVVVSNESDRNVSLNTSLLSVNGYMLSTSGLYCDVAAGKKASDSIEIWSSELSAAGIKTIANVEFIFHLFDTDSYDTVDNSGLISLQTSAAQGFEQPVDDSGELIYEGNGVRVINKGLKDDGIWDGTLVLFVENSSQKQLTVHSEDVSINGFMVSDSFYTELRPGTRCIEGLYLLSLEDAGIESIEEIENIEFALKLIDDNWNTLAKTDPIVLSFK